jgi:cation:H+ antiporter
LSDSSRRSARILRRFPRQPPRFFAGEHEVGIGVVLGSNLFNLAALMGLAGFIAVDVPLKPSLVLFGGAVSLVESAIVALLLLHLIPTGVAVALICAVFAAYALALCLRVSALRRLPLQERTLEVLGGMIASIHADESGIEAEADRSQQSSTVRGSHRSWRVAGALALIVAGSMGIVHACLRIAAAWELPKSLVGALVLAGLTGLPNAYTAARLAKRRAGASIVSETLNSNIINIVVGIGLPALVFGVAAKAIALVEMWFLLGLTCVAIGAAAFARGLGRGTGALIVGVYAVFVVVRVYLH